jgi:hypothetical protein
VLLNFAMHGWAKGFEFFRKPIYVFDIIKDMESSKFVGYALPEITQWGSFVLTCGYF